MANPEHLAKLKEGVVAWNQWREDDPSIEPDLNQGILRSADLSGANLSGTNLKWAHLTGADLTGADLRRAELLGAQLSGADMSGANLSRADLSRAELRGAALSGADLCWVGLSRADLRTAFLGGANLDGASLYEARLDGAYLNGANLYGAYLQNANLQKAIFDGANLTGARLWETQRAGWSIKGVICERAFWDEDGKQAVEYGPGEFEQLYSEQLSIQFFYQGGISTFEINTLPALLHRLASQHPDANIRLKTIEATGGGTTVSISIGDVDEQTKAEIESSAAEVLQAQLALRNDDVRRLQFERDFFQTRLDSITNALIAAAAPQIHFHAPVNTAAIPSGNATVELHQTFNDNSGLIQLIDKLLTRNTELTRSQSMEIEATKAELQKPNPDRTVLSRSLDFLKSLPKEAILKGAGKLGEKAVETDWSSLIHQMSTFISHLH